MSAMILETLMLQRILFAVRMAATEPNSNGYTPMDDNLDREADEVYQRRPVRTYTIRCGI